MAPHFPSARAACRSCRRCTSMPVCTGSFGSPTRMKTPLLAPGVSRKSSERSKSSYRWQCAGHPRLAPDRRWCRLQPSSLPFDRAPPSPRAFAVEEQPPPLGLLLRRERVLRGARRPQEKHSQKPHHRAARQQVSALPHGCSHRLDAAAPTFLLPDSFAAVPPIPAAASPGVRHALPLPARLLTQSYPRGIGPARPLDVDGVDSTPRSRYTILCRACLASQIRLARPRTKSGSESADPRPRPSHQVRWRGRAAAVVRRLPDRPAGLEKARERARKRSPSWKSICAIKGARALHC